MKCRHWQRISQNIFYDNRGYLQPLRSLDSIKLPFSVKDIYISKSKKNVFRGLHLQLSSPPSKKLLTVIKGSIIAISMCCNAKCKYFGEFKYKEVSSSAPNGILIPRLQAFGYLAIEDETIVITCIDQPYSEREEIGINPKSFVPSLGFRQKIIISKKDSRYPDLNEFIESIRNSDLS